MQILSRLRYLNKVLVNVFHWKNLFLSSKCIQNPNKYSREVVYSKESNKWMHIKVNYGLILKYEIAKKRNDSQSATISVSIEYMVIIVWGTPLRLVNHISFNVGQNMKTKNFIIMDFSYGYTYHTNINKKEQPMSYILLDLSKIYLRI